MISKKLSVTLLYWFGIAMLCCIVMYVFLKLAYIGPPDQFNFLMTSIYKVIFISVAVLGTVVEIIARSMKRFDRGPRNG